MSPVAALRRAELMLGGGGDCEKKEEGLDEADEAGWAGLVGAVEGGTGRGMVGQIKISERKISESNISVDLCAIMEAELRFSGQVMAASYFENSAFLEVAARRYRRFLLLLSNCRGGGGGFRRSSSASSARHRNVHPPETRLMPVVDIGLIWRAHLRYDHSRTLLVCSRSLLMYSRSLF